MSNYVTTGNFRATVLRVTKTIGGVAADGYPKDYSILGAFGTYSIITEDAFRKLSDASYNGRLTAFYDYIEEEEGRSYFPTSGNTGTGECEAGKSLIMYGMLYNYNVAEAISEYYDSTLGGVTGPTGLGGWRLPELSEWSSLVNDGGGIDYSTGWILMSTRAYPQYNHPRWNILTNQSNTSGLNILPAGIIRRHDNSPVDFGEYGTFWAQDTVTHLRLAGFRTKEQMDPMYVSNLEKASYTDYHSKTGLSIRLVSDDLTEYTSDGDTGTFTDEDGNNYITKRIGSLVWMCENLKVTKIDGQSIPIFTPGIAPTTEDLAAWYPDGDINNK